ncbi:MAG: hypothetical protein M1817_001541 [Caeruleum heppii]|nr:MAG: hypothetical protein M1817_001541 [Caeruleum heppii]
MRPASQRASTAWTPQEDRLLMEARARGENWGPIQQAHFATKTPNACRKRHERLREKRNVENWDEERLEGLAKEYMIMRKEIWSPLADRVGEKWSVVEAKCMEKGLRSIHSVVRTAERRDAAASVTSGTDDSGVAGLGTEKSGAKKEQGEPRRILACRQTSVE